MLLYDAVKLRSTRSTCNVYTLVLGYINYHYTTHVELGG